MFPQNSRNSYIRHKNLGRRARPLIQSISAAPRYTSRLGMMRTSVAFPRVLPLFE